MNKNLTTWHVESNLKNSRKRIMRTKTKGKDSLNSSIKRNQLRQKSYACRRGNLLIEIAKRGKLGSEVDNGRFKTQKKKKKMKRKRKEERKRLFKQPS